MFVVAGAAKLAAGSAWIAQARQMGASQPVATVVPGIELVLGAALVTGIAMPLPALAAIVLLVAFSVVIARQLVDGRHPPCACFGTWSTRPLSDVHLRAQRRPDRRRHHRLLRLIRVVLADRPERADRVGQAVGQSVVRRNARVRASSRQAS